MKTNKPIVYLVFGTFVMFSCGNKQEVAEHESSFIEISNHQFQTDSMQLGKIETRLFENTVKCYGTIVPLPNGIAKVNAPLNGIIKSINCYNGELVDRNQPLIEITGNEIIEIQQEFAEASASYKRLKSEYERIKNLFNEKVAAEKDFIAAETEFKISMAKYNGLKLKIESIGLPTSKIENGEFYSSYYLKSPIKGYISNFDASIGSYIDSQVELLEIINPDMLQVKLSVFPKDIINLKKGQAVQFKSDNTDNYQLATISSIGAAIDNESKSIPCFASISDRKSAKLFANMHIEANIITQIDTVAALPKSALVRTENKHYILALKNKDSDKYVFIKQIVVIGRDYKDYIEIIDNNIDGLLLTKGGYNININE